MGDRFFEYRTLFWCSDHITVELRKDGASGHRLLSLQGAVSVGGRISAAAHLLQPFIPTRSEVNFRIAKLSFHKKNVLSER